MTSQSPDTIAEVEKVQIDLIRKASICKRISVARSLSQTVMYLARRAIRRANPSMSEQEVDLAFVENHYGKKLAESLRLYMESKRL